MSAFNEILAICIREMGVQKVMEIATRSLPSASSPPHVASSAAAPGAPKKVKIIVKAKKADEPVAQTASVVKNLELVLEDMDEPAPSSSSVIVLTSASAPPAVSDSSTKVKVKVKKPTDAPTCDGRVEGDKIEMEGTKAPNGNPLHCYKVAQCERKGTEAVSVDGGEGDLHLCKICIKRYTARAEQPHNWHGFFDDDGAPETSHFEGGAWYKKKMAAAAAKAENE